MFNISLSKSQASIKHLSSLSKQHDPKINYDSFLEYLNETVKTPTNIVTSFACRKKSKFSKNELSRLKETIDNATQKSTKYSKKSTSAINTINNSVGSNFSTESVLRLNKRLKTNINWITNYSRSPLNHFSPDYGIKDMAKMISKSSTIKRTNSTKPRRKRNSKHAKGTAQASLERSKEHLDQTKEGMKIGRFKIWLFGSWYLVINVLWAF